ncbi:MAG: hypothetical protein PHW53_04350 [Patescibacteria group bacterium]|nr:hypothetical protein [Patescibacteria group bacterium]
MPASKSEINQGVEEEQMPKNKYCCPGCEVVLNPGTKIILIAQNTNKREELILLIPQETDYRVVMSAGFLKSQEAAKLFCPVCHYDLMVAKDSRFAQIERVTEDGHFSTVMFSRIFSESAVFVAK